MINITSPLNNDTVKTLKAGDLVEISGIIYTARDAAHKKLARMIENEEVLPFDIESAVIYYTGATPAKTGELIGSCGPTTSARMDSYTPDLLNKGLKGIIGKGNRNQAVIDALITNSAVYFVAIGGAGAYYKSTVTDVELIAFPELQSEAIYKLTVKKFKAIVAIDSFGNTIF